MEGSQLRQRSGSVGEDRLKIGETEKHNQEESQEACCEMSFVTEREVTDSQLSK